MRSGTPILRERPTCETQAFCPELQDIAKKKQKKKKKQSKNKQETMEEDLRKVCPRISPSLL